VQNIIPKIRMQGVSKVLLTDVWESSETFFAIPLGKQEGAKSQGNWTDQRLYRLSQMPISVPHDHRPFHNTRMELTEPWWITKQDNTTLIIELGNPRFAITETVDLKDSIESNTTIRKTDSRLVLIAADPNLAKSILWLARSTQDGVNLLFGAFILRMKEDTNCLLAVKEATDAEATRTVTETQYVSNIRTQWIKDSETMTSAEYSTLKLEDGRTLIIRSSRKNSDHASQGGYAKAKSKVLRFKIDITFR
jgi:hypothetical protein